MTNQAHAEYQSIRNCVAFTINGAKRRNVNQYMREYSFSDGSILRIYKRGFASVANGPGDYQVTIIGNIKINAFGK
jgi:hypothetical protein